MDSSTAICWVSPSFLGFRVYFVANLLANNADPDKMPHYVGSDLGLHCLYDPFTGFQVKLGYGCITEKKNLVV